MTRTVFVLVIIISMLLTSNMVALASYPDPGEGVTNIYVQNIGTDPATVQLGFTPADTGGDQVLSEEYSIDPGACKTIMYTKFPSEITEGWAGAAEVSGTENMAAVVRADWDNPSHPAQYASRTGMYKGVDAPANEAFVPLVTVRDGLQTSRVTVQNTADSEASITIHWYDRNGTEDTAQTVETTIPAKSQKTFATDVILPDFTATGGIGSAYVTSDTPIAVVASIHWDSYMAYSSDLYSAAATGDTTLWFPSVFRKLNASCGDYNNLSCWYNQNIVTVQNIGDTPTDVRFEFWRYDGELSYVMTKTVQPRASTTINTAVKGMLSQSEFDDMVSHLGQDYWKGTVKAISKVAAGQTVAQPLTGICQYIARSSGVEDWVIYNAIRDGEATTKGLSVPLVYRKRNLGALDVWSTTLVQNLSGTAGRVKVELFRNADGTKLPGEWTLNIPANGMLGLNFKVAVDLPTDAWTLAGDNYTGSMVVTPLDGISIVGETNIFWDGTGRGAAYTSFPLP